MEKSRHPTVSRVGLHLFALCSISALAVALRAQDDVNDIRAAAKPATAPATAQSPDGASIQRGTAALVNQKTQIGGRQGVIVLSDGTKLEGQIAINVGTPCRVWVEESKTYKDIDLSMVKKIEVHVLSETMEDDWRWLKEGSDQKVYSGQKYPNVSLAYQFTLNNDQVIEGTVVALIYITDANKKRTLTLYKQYKGNLDETLKDLVYIKSITLEPAVAESEKKSTHLPLLED